MRSGHGYSNDHINVSGVTTLVFETGLTLKDLRNRLRMELLEAFSVGEYVLYWTQRKQVRSPGARAVVVMIVARLGKF